MGMLLGLALLGCGAQESASQIVVIGPDGTEEITPCATGCAAPTPDEHEHLGDDKILGMLQEMAGHPVGAPILATETLLFHLDETRDYLIRVGTGPLPPDHAAWLQHELARDQVEIGLRLVADDGTVLGWRDDQIPLREKQHLLLQDMGPLGRADVNGKVKRVGVKHLWARF